MRDFERRKHFQKECFCLWKLFAGIFQGGALQRIVQPALVQPRDVQHADSGRNGPPSQAVRFFQARFVLKVQIAR
jgi:hypothetical protein